MNERQLQEFLKYSNSRELYVVTWNNLLKKLFCPFKVVVIHDIGELKKGKAVMVEEVKITMELKTVYLIKNKYYYHNHFNILID